MSCGEACELTAGESNCVGKCRYWVERWWREGKKEGRVQECDHSTVQTQEEAERRTDGDGVCGRGFGTDLIGNLGRIWGGVAVNVF